MKQRVACESDKGAHPHLGSDDYKPSIRCGVVCSRLKHVLPLFIHAVLSDILILSGLQVVVFAKDRTGKSFR